ncbi:MAG: hypothetical protein DYG89_16545 [Caldilinea sp. CFX5]|nr:hypothetical protein [Caldilinea sp. CFX5]
MKNVLMLIGRLALILLAATVVVGITMRFVDTNATNRLAPIERNAFNQASADDAGQSAATTQPGEGHAFRGEGHSPRNQSLAGRLTFGLFGFAKNFAIIGVVVLVVVGLERFFVRRLSGAAV